MDKKDEKRLKKALMDKALGYTTQEIIEEYGYTGEDFVLQKKKTSYKTYPPDLSAMQMLLGDVEEGDKLVELSNEELEAEKIRLIKLLKEKK
ncbi:MAG: hypothetical protein E7356_00875 [Clostridiales bacterium]|nr:hypothetical protein [Clostridiales bacterium]